MGRFKETAHPFILHLALPMGGEAGEQRGAPWILPLEVFRNMRKSTTRSRFFPTLQYSPSTTYWPCVWKNSSSQVIDSFSEGTEEKRRIQTFLKRVTHKSTVVVMNHPLVFAVGNSDWCFSTLLSWPEGPNTLGASPAFDKVDGPMETDRGRYVCDIS